MLFAIARRDKPGMGDKRAELLAAHAEYQKAFMSVITFANAPYPLGGVFETVIIEPFLQRVPALTSE